MMLLHFCIYLVVIIAYNAYDYIKDLPFRYITQTNYAVCEKMNNTFCIRISYFVMAILVYLITINFINAALLRDAPKIANTITHDEPSYFGAGSLIGGALPVVSYASNVIFGFSAFNGFKPDDDALVKNIAVIFTGMFMTSFTEELIFRGLLIGITKSFLNVNVCVLLSALIFGYVHVKSSLKYGVIAFITGIILGIGYLQYGLYWCIGFHALFNFVETLLYTLVPPKIINKTMVGERKTPDDDGMMTSLVDIIALGGLYHFNYFG
jgi:membrane protease YdiL (CAAX protease family)